MSPQGREKTDFPNKVMASLLVKETTLQARIMFAVTSELLNRTERKHVLCYMGKFLMSLSKGKGNSFDPDSDIIKGVSHSLVS